MMCCGKGKQILCLYSIAAHQFQGHIINGSFQLSIPSTTFYHMYAFKPN